MRCSCSKVGGKAHHSGGKKKHHKSKKHKSSKKRGCRVAGVSVPKSKCGCVRREMKGVKGSKEMRKRLTKNTIAHC